MYFIEGFYEGIDEINNYNGCAIFVASGIDACAVVPICSVISICAAI